jgi:hypothetical protein
VNPTAEDRVTAIENLLRHGQILPAQDLLDRIERIVEGNLDD